MPNKTVWAVPELAFRLSDGRPVYHVYENDEDMVSTPYYYTLSDDPDDETTNEFVLDVRDLPKIPGQEEGDRWLISAHMRIIQNAYDQGLLKVPE